MPDTPAWLVGLSTDGYAVREGFLGSTNAELLLQGARSLDERGLLRHKVAANAGSALGQLSLSMRRDRGMRLDWLGGQATGLLCGDDKTACRTLTQRLGEAIEALQALDPLLEPLPEVLQLAHYPGEGAFYVTHRDRDLSEPRRSLSFVYYINPPMPAWNLTESGGALHLYKAGTEDQLFAVIAPVHDRLVIFDADLYHEVRPCFRSRFAVNAWVNSRRDMPRASASPISTESITRIVRGALPLALAEAFGEDTAGAVAEAAALSEADDAADVQATAQDTRRASLLARIASARTQPPRSADTVAIPVPLWFEHDEAG